MERLHQMKVIPDVIPDLHPSIDIHVSARTTYKDMKITGKKHFTVEPGTFLLPEQVRTCYRLLPYRPFNL